MIMKWGFYIHLMGIFGDASMAARVYVKETNWFRTSALVLVSIYTLLWVGWLIATLVVRYRHTGKVCSGSYLSDSEQTGSPILGYAIVQGQVV